MTTKVKAILVDGNSLLYRAFFAMPHFSTIENQPTNAVYGFTMMLLRLIEESKPDVLIVSFDAPAKNFRHDEYDKYKAHRKPAPDDLKSQGPLAREVVESLGIPIIEIEGFEADDVIGTLACKAENEGFDVTIVTGDKDTFQLIEENVRVMITVKGVTETKIYDEAAVEERFGLRPDQFSDFKGLVGDPSDNIPGVPGVGEKTASKLLKQFGTLENLLASTEQIENPKLRTLIETWTDQARLSKRLATIITEVPFEIDLTQCKYGNMDTDRLKELFKRLEFRSLLKKISDAPVKVEVQGNLFAESAVPLLASVKLAVVNTRDELNALLEELKLSQILSLHIHGSSENGVGTDALGIALSFSPGKAYFVPFTSENGLALEDFRTVLQSGSLLKSGHNLKFEHEICNRYEIDLKGDTFDVMLAAYLLNPTRGTHSLSELSLDYMGTELPVKIQKTGAVNRPKGEGTNEEFLAAQVDAVQRLTPILRERLAVDGLSSLMTDIEMPLVRILAEIECNGVAVDTGWLDRLSEMLGNRIEEVEKETYLLAGTDFNIGSPKQLGHILFEKLGLPTTKKNKTGYSTDADTLAGILSTHEIIPKILEYRELTKLKSTYADSLPKLVDPGTKRIHTSLNQAVTATGRLSSSEPNLQNIPIKTDIGRQIRRAFVASPGNVLVSADYSQIELRILAHVSRDPELMRAFTQSEDVHTKTAATIFDIQACDVTPDMRRQAKTVNFAVIYGMSEYGLSRELNIPMGIAKAHIENYFREYPGVKAYAAETLKTARIKGYVESLLGRRRYMPELNSPNRNMREFAERAAVNMPIQATAADIVKLAMIQVHGAMEQSQCRAQLVLQVHDELVFDVPEDELSAILPLIRHSMESAFTLDVPLKVDVKAGKDWCTAQPLSAGDYQEV